MVGRVGKILGKKEKETVGEGKSMRLPDFLAWGLDLIFEIDGVWFQHFESNVDIFIPHP